MAKRLFTAGSTGKSIDIFIQDSSTSSGAGLQGISTASAGLQAAYRAGSLGVPTTFPLTMLSSADQAWASGGLFQLSSAAMPGVYRLDLPDAVLASTPAATVYLGGATNMVPVVAELQVVSSAEVTMGVNVVQFGGTAVTGRDIGASVLLSSGTGTGQITLTSGVVSAAVTSVTSAAGATIADDVLDRDMSVGTDSGSTTVRTIRQALRFLRNKWAISGTTLTVYKEDDTTSSWTSTLTPTAGADPITGSDPAG